MTLHGGILVAKEAVSNQRSAVNKEFNRDGREGRKGKWT